MVNMVTGRYHKEIAAVFLLFFLALGLRLWYQNESVVDQPVRADAQQYFWGGYNLFRFGVFATVPPEVSDVAPLPNAGRAPGYSLFLVNFFPGTESIPQFLDRVTSAQAVLGALVVVMTFLLARYSLGLRWAIPAGVLALLSPHLVSMDNYLLAESLFTFTVLLATLVLLVSWRRQHALLAVLAGALFGFALLTRPVALLLGPFVAFVYLLDARNGGRSARRIWVKQFLCFGLGFALIYGPFVVRNHVVLEGPQDVGGLFGNVVYGSYVNMIHKNPAMYGFPYRDDPEKDQLVADKAYFLQVFKERFRERPWAYVKWYMGGKVLCSWRWSIASGQGDVYVYPMIRPGFHVNAFLFGIRSVMYWLHWPLVILAFCSPLGLIFLKRRAALDTGSLAVLPAMLILIYHAVVMTVVLPLPRYSIPLRPYTYVLSLWMLSMCVSWLSGRNYVFQKNSDPKHSLTE